MRFGTLICLGVAIYAVVALAWSAMQLYGLADGFAPRALEVVVLLIACLVAGSALKFRDWKDILPYSIGWAIIAAALDAAFVAPVSGWGLYAQWGDWIWYVLVILLPLLSPLVRRQAAADRAWET